MIKLKWVSADGGTLTLNNYNDDNCLFFGLTGLSAPEGEIITQRAPFQHGQTSVRTLCKPREIKFTLKISSKTITGLESLKRTVGGLFSPISSTDTVNTGTLTVIADDGSRYAISAASQGIEMPAGKGTRGPLFQLANIYLMADDPFFRDETQSSVSLTQGTPANVTNAGNVAAEPLIQITGPCNAPKLENLTTGKLIKITANIASGYRVDFDHRFGKKSITQVKISDGTQTSLLQYLDPAVTNEFWSLPIGVNSVKLSSDDAAGSGPVLWYNRYLAIG